MQAISVSFSDSELLPNMNEDLDDRWREPVLRQDLRLFAARIDAEFNKFRTVVVHGFDQTNQRFDSIDSKLTAIDIRLDSVDTRLDSVDTRLDSVDTRLDSVDAKLNSVDTRLNSMDVKMGGFEKQFESIQLQFAGVHTRFDDLKSQIKSDKIMTHLGFVAVVVAIFWQGR